MSAGYLNSKVTLDRAAGIVHAEFEIRNQSPVTWKRTEGFAVGYHLFDADTGNLLVDGPRTALPSDLEPGQSARISVAIELPPGNGRYEIFLSPMREHVCWFYETGWPFLLVEATATGAGPQLGRVRVATTAAVRREHALRSVGRAIVYPLRTVWRNRALIRVMVRRDILGRYRGSFAGSFWTIIHPLLLMLTYFYVFGVVLQSRVAGSTSKVAFALYFLAGMLPWLAFSEAAGRAPSVMLEHRNFVKKLVFAVETLPINLVVSGFVTECFAIALYCGFLAVTQQHVPLSIAWLPALLLPQLMFTAGLAWFLAALGVFVRDLGQFIGFLLTLWFFVTPICYPETSVHPQLAPIVTKNPMYVLVKGYRDIFLEGHAPAAGPLWKLWLLSIIVFVVGHAWFYKLRRSFADMI